MKKIIYLKNHSRSVEENTVLKDEERAMRMNVVKFAAVLAMVAGVAWFLLYLFMASFPAF